MVREATVGLKVITTVSNVQPECVRDPIRKKKHLSEELLQLLNNSTVKATSQINGTLT